MRSSDNVKNWGTPKEEEEWKGGGERSREVRRESIGISQYKGYITMAEATVRSTLLLRNK